MKLASSKAFAVNAVVSVVFSEFIISYILLFLGITSEGVSEFILVPALAVLFVCRDRKKTKLSCYEYASIAYLFFGVAILLCRISGKNVTYSDQYAVYYLVYGALAFTLTMVDFNIEKVLKNMMMLSSIVVFMGERFWGQVAVQRMGGSSIVMGVSYALLPGVLAFLLHFFYFRKVSLKLAILYGINLYLALRMIFTGTRGAVLGVLLCIYYIIIDHSRDKANKRKVSTGWTIGFCVVSFFIAMQNEIVTICYEILKFLGIYMNFFYKSYELIGEFGSILNNREGLWLQSSRVISENPLGIGVSGFETMTGGEYPHNLFVQFLVEYGWCIGILLSVGILLIYLKSISKDFETKIIISFFFFSLIPRLMLSSTYWKDQFFWFFLIYGLYTIRRYRRKAYGYSYINTVNTVSNPMKTEGKGVL